MSFNQQAIAFGCAQATSTGKLLANNQAPPHKHERASSPIASPL
ncbi:MAG: hypothetical protein AAF974_00090 [Cyanobacteria bacterium P01_E01_bin.34]